MNEEVLPKELTSNIARRGKWTVEEERYTEQIIEDFDQGVLDVPEGTTLRTYLSRVLNCDPMRITKKYTGNLCIGKRTFVPKPCVYDSDYQYLGQCYNRLIELRQFWINKLLLTEQWNNRKLTQFRGTKSPMDEPMSGMPSSSSSSFTPMSLFAFGNNNSMMSETGASVSPPNEEANAGNTTTSALTEEDQAVGISEFKVFNSIRPFVRDIIETELIIEWLKSCSTLVYASQVPESQLLDQLTASCSLSLASLYKVLLSGCVGEFKLLHSCVQAVFERLILANEAPRTSAPILSNPFPTAANASGSGSGGVLSLAASMMPVSLSSGDLQQLKMETVSNDDQDTVSEASSDLGGQSSIKRVKYEHSVTPTLGTPTHPSGEAEVEILIIPAGPSSSSSSSTANPVTPTAASSKLSLEECVKTLKHKRSLQVMRGPISATAAEYKEQQHRALESTTVSSAGASGGPFLSGFDPQSLSQKLSHSLNQSMVTISRSVLDHSRNSFPAIGGSNHMMYASNIESAAEALLGLISN